MTTFTAIAGTETQSGKPLTESLLTRLANNCLAIAEGDATAPKIQSGAFDSDVVEASAMAADAIEQATLNTSKGAVSVYQSGYATLPGGQYGFFPQIRSGNSNFAHAQAGTTSTSYTTRIFAEGASSTTTYLEQRYINSSPPYDMGHGEIAQFVFALIDNGTGQILATYAADCAPWHYNGPTDIKAVRQKNGQKYAVDPSKFDTLSAAEKKAAVAVLSGSDSPASKNDKSLSKLLVSIDQEWKNRDMPIIPHPFQGNDLSGKTVVLIDPTSNIADDLALRSLTGDNVSEMLHSKHIRLDNQQIEGVATPEGVMVVSASLR